MKLLLKNVRLAFPNLFTAQQVNGQGDPKFGGAFIFAPDHPAKKLVTDACRAVATEEWGAKADEVLKAIAASDKLCIHNGDTKADYEGYGGMYFVNTSNKTRPLVIDRNKSPLTAQDGKPYAGCYVNASIELWAQDNKFGKRINASLRGVQFEADGDAFAGGGVADEGEFESLEAPAAGAAGDDLI